MKLSDAKKQYAAGKFSLMDLTTESLLTKFSLEPTKSRNNKLSKLPPSQLRLKKLPKLSKVSSSEPSKLKDLPALKTASRMVKPSSLMSKMVSHSSKRVMPLMSSLVSRRSELVLLRSSKPSLTAKESLLTSRLSERWPLSTPTHGLSPTTSEKISSSTVFKSSTTLNPPSPTTKLVNSRPWEKTSVTLSLNSLSVEPSNPKNNIKKS